MKIYRMHYAIQITIHKILRLSQYLCCKSVISFETTNTDKNFHQILTLQQENSTIYGFVGNS